MVDPEPGDFEPIQRERCAQGIERDQEYEPEATVPKLAGLR